MDKKADGKRIVFHRLFGAGDGRSIGFDSPQFHFQKESAPEGRFFLEMGYKKDILGSFAYEFELSPNR